MTDQTRAAFEAHFQLTQRQAWQHKDGTYQFPEIQAKWEGWQAAVPVADDNGCKSCAILRRYEKTARERGYAMGKAAGNNELAQVQELLAFERKAHAETNAALTAEITRLEAQLAAAAPNSVAAMLEGYAESYEQMGRTGNGKVDCISVATDIRQNMIPAAAAPGAVQRRCKQCHAPRKGETCQKCGEPTFVPHSSWEEPELPPVDRIRELAREAGYAIGEHGTKERDLDLIAAPWTEDSFGNHALMQHIAKGLGAKIVEIERKPQGRYACTIQMDGYYKPIDLSICPQP